MEFTWEGVLLFILVLIVGSFIAGFIDVYLEDRKRHREQAAREELQLMDVQTEPYRDKET